MSETAPVSLSPLSLGQTSYGQVSRRQVVRGAHLNLIFIGAWPLREPMVVRSLEVAS